MFISAVGMVAALCVASSLGSCGGNRVGGGDGGSETGGDGSGSVPNLGEGTGSTDGSTAGASSGTSDGTSSGATAGSTAGSGGTPNLECTPDAEEKTVATSGAVAGPLYGVPMEDDGTAFAWASGGKVYVAWASAAGASAGAPFEVSGKSVHGLARGPSGLAVLVSRATDELWFVRFNAAGEVGAETKLTGTCDHAVVGCEWYSYTAQFHAEGGRLFWNGTHYGAYFPIYRRWPDNIAHTGDTLRLLDDSGAAKTGGWSWGCSHSLDVRLAQSGTTLAPVCLSDCYKSKGISFKNDKVLFSEPSGNCAGTSGATLGGLVALVGNFYMSYASSEGRASKDIGLVRFSTTGVAQAPVWIATGAEVDDAPHLAAF
jgi:hypothetical protein